MSAKYVIPFNFQPSSVVIETIPLTTYTVPAGFYARVEVSIVGTSSIYIDSALALTGSATQVLSSSDVQSSTAPGVKGLLTTGTSTSPANAFTSASLAQTVTAGYWLPEGTEIYGTNIFSIVVSLYPMIS